MLKKIRLNNNKDAVVPYKKRCSYCHKPNIIVGSKTIGGNSKAKKWCTTCLKLLRKYHK